MLAREFAHQIYGLTHWTLFATTRVAKKIYAVHCPIDYGLMQKINTKLEELVPRDGMQHVPKVNLNGGTLQQSDAGRSLESSREELPPAVFSMLRSAT